jgi:phospholipid/cholesterol/gamma-HCH transport system permease protein
MTDADIERINQADRDPQAAGLATHDDGATLALTASGAWVIAQAASADALLLAVPTEGRVAVQIDLAQVTRMDTAGAWLIHRTKRAAEAHGAVVTLTGSQAKFDTLLAAIAAREQKPPKAAYHEAWHTAIVIRAGHALVDAWRTTKEAVGFLGLLLESIGRCMIEPRRLRLTSTVYHMEQAGLNAVPIVALMSFLIGAVLAFQGATQLQKFGAEVFTVNLVGISFLREVGILLTAILVAGRSGSAFTAQIGSMKLREEIDAMRTLGLNPMEVLVVPRVVALILMMPILGFISAMMGLAGGMAILWLTAGMSPWAYVERVNDAVSLWSFWVGMIKAPVFGLLIGLIGCFEGMKVEGSAESVGQRTTQSVVEGIFIVIVADAFFSIMFEIIGV